VEDPIYLAPTSPEMRVATDRALDLLAGELGLADFPDEELAARAGVLLREAVSGLSVPEILALIHRLSLICATVLAMYVRREDLPEKEDGEWTALEVLAVIGAALRSP
jgi:hypothetical protein